MSLARKPLLATLTALSLVAPAPVFAAVAEPEEEEDPDFPDESEDPDFPEGEESDASASDQETETERPDGDEASDDDEGGKKKKKKRAKREKKEKKGKKKKSKADEDDGDEDKDADDADSGERFIDKHAPENHMVDVGLYLGAFFIPNNHGLFDRGIGPQPSLPNGAFDIGFRAAYMPLRFLGVGLDIGGMPTRSDSENARANARTIRAHVIGQGPWRITPTLVLGGGVLAVSSPAEILNGSEGAFHWGPGVKMHINDWIAVRVDGRHIVTGGGADGNRANYGELLFGLDVTLRVGRWVSGDRAKRNKDRDEDGVPDRFDACPDEYGEDDEGCPENRDRDKDGVPDRRDRCPKEWGDGPGGCPTRDKDSDGVIDTKDSCEDQPETFNGFQDLDGCPDEAPEEVKQLTGVLQGIYFQSGEAKILRKSHRTLDRVVETLKKFPDVRVNIVGHTDDTGTKEGNKVLSQQRADAVKAYIVGKGIEAERVQTRGAGQDEPVADNKTKPGRAKNRRIEFQVIGQQAEAAAAAAPPSAAEAD